MINLPPKVEGVCDQCDGELYQRDDDMPAAIEKRLETYERETSPLINFYRTRDLLKEITVNEDFGSHKELIMSRIMEAIKS